MSSGPPKRIAKAKRDDGAFFIPTLAEWREEAPWGLWASQASLLAESQPMRGFVSKMNKVDSS